MLLPNRILRPRPHPSLARFGKNEATAQCLQTAVSVRNAASSRSYDRGNMLRLWCWRCKVEVPMLDEHEYAEIFALYRLGTEAVKSYRLRNRASLESVPRGELFAPMLARYEAMTGYKELNPNAVLHHRLSLYGPPCRNCGKPLRTPKAKLCGCCMAPRV